MFIVVDISILGKKGLDTFNMSRRKSALTSTLTAETTNNLKC